MKQKFCQMIKHVHNLRFEIFQPQKINYSCDLSVCSTIEFCALKIL